MGKLDNKLALITGGSRGIGRAIALKFSAEGCKIAINYNKSREAAENLKSTIPGSEIFQADVSDHAAVAKMIAQIHEKMGRIDILVNNAGIFDLFSWNDFDDARIQKTIDTNLMGQIYAVKECMEDLKQKHGIVINMASNAGVGTAASNTTFYSISKAGVIMLTKRLAFDLMEYHVRVNAIAPGWVESDMTTGNKTQNEIIQLQSFFKQRSELNMTGKPEYIANTALFLASSDSEYMNGQVIVVDGGRTDNLTHSL
ncbi:MAG: SDR family oxidoreductase [Ferroplasma sp.]